MNRGRVFVLAVLLALPCAVRAQDEPKKSPEKIRLELRNAPLAGVLKALAARDDRTVVFREEVAERVSLSFTNMTAEEAFDQLLALHGYRKETDGKKTIVTRRVPDAGTTAAVVSGDDPLGKLYVLACVRSSEAVTGIARITSERALVDVLPGDRQLLVRATPADHQLARAWLDEADRPRIEERLFRLMHRTLAGVDSSVAATADPIARDVSQLLTPVGSLAVDLGRNSLLVKDDAAALERVSQRLAALDRAPATVALEVAVIEQVMGEPLRGFAPANDLPAAFADSGTGGLVTCFATDAGPLAPLATGIVDDPNADEDTELRGQPATAVCDERKAAAFEVEGLRTGVTVTPRIVAGGVDLEVHIGAVEARVRAPSGRAVALRGIVKTEKWHRGWSDRQRELIVLVRATGSRPATAVPPIDRPREERLPDLMLPDWRAASGK